MMHPWIERTSPKGTPFVGTCQSCGATGLTMKETRGECVNPSKMTNEQALVGAIGGKA